MLIKELWLPFKVTVNQPGACVDNTLMYVSILLGVRVLSRAYLLLLFIFVVDTIVVNEVFLMLEYRLVKVLCLLKITVG